MVLKGRQLHDHAFIYAYQLDPPQPEPRFTKIKALLRRAKLAAGRNGELWTGRIVVETNITHILVVTDDPHQVHEVDRAIQAELKRLNMKFALTGPAVCVPEAQEACSPKIRPADPAHPRPHDLSRGLTANRSVAPLQDTSTKRPAPRGPRAQARRAAVRRPTQSGSYRRMGGCVENPSHPPKPLTQEVLLARQEGTDKSEGVEPRAFATVHWARSTSTVSAGAKNPTSAPAQEEYVVRHHVMRCSPQRRTRNVGLGYEQSIAAVLGGCLSAKRGLNR